MRGPGYAAGMAAVLMLASLLFGPLVIPAGAVVALVTLRHGTGAGLKVLLLASVLGVAVRLLMSGHALPMLVWSLVAWLPAWVMASNLRRSQEQAPSMLMIALLVGCYALAMRLTVGDVAAFWAERLDLLFSSLAAQGRARLGAGDIEIIARQIHAWTLVALFTTLAATILLARWWQAALYNPGGFGTEFRRLKLPRQALALVIAGALALVMDAGGVVVWPLAGDVFVVVVVLFALQGLAVIHHRARSVELARQWLAGLYVLLVLMPQIVGPVLATTGVADSMADFRHLRRRERHDAGGD